MMNNKKQQEEHLHMLIKVLEKFDPVNSAYYENTEDNYIYFKILSSHYLSKYTFRMDVADFNYHFSQEDLPDKSYKDVYRSRNWLFRDKVDWWNKNINAVKNSHEGLDIKTSLIYNDLVDEYCRKFNCRNQEFVVEQFFFDDLLTHYKVEKKGKLRAYKTKNQ